MKPESNRSAGFTFLEVLVAMAVFGILTGTVAYVLTSQSRLGVRNTDIMKGFSYATQKLDSLKVLTYDSLSSGSDTTDDHFLRCWQVSALTDVSGTLNGRKKIEISVYWPLTAQHTLSVATLVSNDRFKENP